MRIALILDEERLVREHRMLNRLAIGLIGEGLQLTRIVPEIPDSPHLDEDEKRIALAARLESPMHVLPWMRRDRARRLADAMEKDVPDAIYAVGVEAWALGLDLARALERPLAIDIWSAELIRRVPRGRAGSNVSGYIVPTVSMAEALRQRVEPELVGLVPPGVAVPTAPRRILDAPEQAIALAIIGGGRDVPAYRALLTGLDRVVRRMPQVQVFLELEGPHGHEIWRHARRLELLENVSTITDASQHRGLIMRCDVLVIPEQYGELRSILLEAMAFGMPVVAIDDPFLDMLVDGETASIVHRPDAEEWTGHLLRLLTDPEVARALGLAGRERIATAHRSSDQVNSLLAALKRIVSGDVYPFDDAEA